MSLEGITNSKQSFTRRELLIFSSIANTRSGSERNSAIKILEPDEKRRLYMWREERKKHMSESEKKLPFMCDVSDLKDKEKKYMNKFSKK